MSRKRNRVIVSILCGLLTFGILSFSAGSSFVMVSEAHSGRTDSSGGHKDNKNKSGLGSYHYHCGGHEAHLHPNGVCPYSSTSSNVVQETTRAAEVPQPETTAAPVTGWQQDQYGWWYKTAEDTYLRDGAALIDGEWYYFNYDGYMLIGWQEIDDDWYYFDQKGHMAIGDTVIDGESHHFDSNGCWDDDYYDD